MAGSVVSFLFCWCSTGGPTVQLSAGWWLPLLHLISIFSGPQLIRAPSPFGLVWLSLPHIVYNSVRYPTGTVKGPKPLRPDVALPTTTRLSPSPTLTGTGTVLTSVLTELYNSSTPTRSHTRFLKSHVWSSWSANNCHAVHRSLSSDASVYECIMRIFYLSHFISQFPPTRFPLITAIRMWHFLQVHHLGMAFLAGSKAKIQHHWEPHSSGFEKKNLNYYSLCK